MDSTTEYRSINLQRKMLRYTLAVLSTALIAGIINYLFYQEKFTGGSIDYSKLYMYQSGLMDFCGIIISMLVPCVLLYALVKQFILKSNENYWPNTLLFILLSFLLFSLLMSLTWGLGFSK